MTKASTKVCCHCPGIVWCNCRSYRTRTRSLEKQLIDSVIYSNYSYLFSLFPMSAWMLHIVKRLSPCLITHCERIWKRHKGNIHSTLLQTQVQYTHYVCIERSDNLSGEKQWQAEHSKFSELWYLYIYLKIRFRVLIISWRGELYQSREETFFWRLVWLWLYGHAFSD